MHGLSQSTHKEGQRKGFMSDEGQLVVLSRSQGVPEDRDIAMLSSFLPSPVAILPSRQLLEKI